MEAREIFLVVTGANKRDVVMKNYIKKMVKQAQTSHLKARQW